jgi:hypothetical protein
LLPYIWVLPFTSVNVIDSELAPSETEPLMLVRQIL